MGWGNGISNQERAHAKAQRREGCSPTPRGTEETRLGPREKKWSREAAGLDAQGRDAPGVPVSQGAFVQGVMRSD